MRVPGTCVRLTGELLRSEGEERGISWCTFRGAWRGFLMPVAGPVACLQVAAAWEQQEIQTAGVESGRNCGAKKSTDNSFPSLPLSLHA